MARTSRSVSDPAPEKKKKGCRRALLIGGIAFGSLFVLSLVIAIFAPESDSESRPRSSPARAATAKPSEIEIYVTADELSDTYRDNEARGNRMFKGKWIQVEGYVFSINEQEVLGGYTVSIEAGDGWNNVSCRTKDEDFVMRLSKGDRVTVVGIGDGQMLGSPSLKDCGPA